jgi:hypothetical protein
MEQQIQQCPGVRQPVAQSRFTTPQAHSTCLLRSGTYQRLIVSENILASTSITLEEKRGSMAVLSSPGRLTLDELQLKSDTLIMAGGDVTIRSLLAPSRNVRITIASSLGEVQVVSASQSVSLSTISRNRTRIPGSASNPPYPAPPFRQIGVRGLNMGSLK